MRTKHASDDTLVLDRRQFLAGAGAAFLMPVTLTLSLPRRGSHRHDRGRRLHQDRRREQRDAHHRPDRDGPGHRHRPRADRGGGAHAQLGQVSFEHAPVDPATYGLPGWGVQLTGGSTSMMMWYTPLRIAAAKAADRLRRPRPSPTAVFRRLGARTGRQSRARQREAHLRLRPAEYRQHEGAHRGHVLAAAAASSAPASRASTSRARWTVRPSSAWT